jgi:hypothetical protein
MTQLRTGLRWGLGLLVAVGLLGMAGGALAQDDTVAQPRTYGTAVPVVHTVQAYTFMPLVSSTAYSAFGPIGQLACTMDPCVFLAPVFLPAGALVTAIQGELCDTHATSDMSVQLTKAASPQGTVTGLAVGHTNGMPGCAFLTVPLPVPETIDNQNNTYSLRVDTGAASPALYFRGVRIFHTLQVSPAPAAATFADVPTGHPFFRFIEALARSGITSGCGNGNFCPDAPLTRGQMAVFLSLGLGLHFAP